MLPPLVQGEELLSSFEIVGKAMNWLSSSASPSSRSIDELHNPNLTSICYIPSPEKVFRCQREAEDLRSVQQDVVAKFSVVLEPPFELAG